MRPENVTSVTISSPAGPGDPEDSGGPRLTPGDLVELQAGEAAHGGSCVARLDGIAGAAGTGPVVFVRHTLPGERVRARITEVTARFARADAVDILDPAPGRVIRTVRGQGYLVPSEAEFAVPPVLSAHQEAHPAAYPAAADVN